LLLDCLFVFNELKAAEEQEKIGKSPYFKQGTDELELGSRRGVAVNQRERRGRDG
jgi:hypothetical protein